MCVCTRVRKWVWVCTCYSIHMEKSGQLSGTDSFLPPCGLCDWLRLPGFWGKHFYPLSHLTCPISFLIKKEKWTFTEVNMLEWYRGYKFIKVTAFSNVPIPFQKKHYYSKMWIHYWIGNEKNFLIQCLTMYCRPPRTVVWSEFLHQPPRWYRCIQETGSFRWTLPSSQGLGKPKEINEIWI